MSVNCIDQYNPNAGNGIGRSLMRDGTEYTAPPPEESHAIVNAYSKHVLHAIKHHARTTPQIPTPLPKQQIQILVPCQN
jgi:hypothetical protein